MEVYTIMSQSNNLVSTNRMTARQLVIKENASLDFVQSPKTRKIFFVCGTKKGYVSPAAQAIYKTGSLDEFQYAEVSKDGEPAIPCLMVVGRSKENVKRSLGDDLLH